MHESVFSDSLFRSLLEEPMMEVGAVALPATELEGLGPGESLAADVAAGDGEAVDDVAELAAV